MKPISPAATASPLRRRAQRQRQFRETMMLSESFTTLQSLVTDQQESSRYYRSPKGAEHVALLLSRRITAAQRLEEELT